MKSVIASIFLITSTSVATPFKASLSPVVKASPAATVVTEVTLSALSQLESGDNDHARGASGERSRYQIMPDVWKRFGRGFKASNKADAKIVATKIWNERVEWFMKQHDRKPTVVELYALWNAPVQAYRLKISPRVMERAVRFEQLVK